MFGRCSINLGHNPLLIAAITLFLIFTLIGVVYKPQHTFFHPSSIITNFLSSDSHPAFNSGFSTFINITESAAVIGEGFSESCDCRADDPINCGDVEVFHLLMRAAIEKFKDIRFYKFGKPVGGDNGTSCHMAWRFRPKEGKLAGFKKDYRSFSVVRSENCTLSVVSIGEYHSGSNAIKQEKVAVKSNSTLVIEDAVDASVMESEGSFSSGKYLIYGGDRCKSMDQYLWSFMCMLGEAQFLNRTLVLDFNICLSKMYSSSGVDEEGKDFRFYFDYEHLKDSASVIHQAEFWRDWNKWRRSDGLKLHRVKDFSVTPMKLVDVKDSLIMRKFRDVEPWFRVCEGEADAVIQRPWHVIWKSRRLLDVASAIASRMSWDYDSVRVERGEKAKQKKLWPNLDRDTSPEALVAALTGKIEGGRNVYIATNEPRKSFFDPLKDKYSIHVLDDHKDLWDANSDWYYETTKLNNGKAVEFDSYMRQSIDSEVFSKGKKQIETFNDLTKDCKDGINTC